MDTKTQKNKISVQELSPLPETSDYLNLGWEGFEKEICFKLLSKGTDGCRKVYVTCEIVPCSWFFAGKFGMIWS